MGGRTLALLAGTGGKWDCSHNSTDHVKSSYAERGLKAFQPSRRHQRGNIWKRILVFDQYFGAFTAFSPLSARNDVLGTLLRSENTVTSSDGDDCSNYPPPYTHTRRQKSQSFVNKLCLLTTVFCSVSEPCLCMTQPFTPKHDTLTCYQ